MCNTYRFQSIQNNCKEFDKCWHWNQRIDEEASTYNETTKWIYQRKKVYWPQTRWGYSKGMLSWKKTKYQLLPKVVIPTISSHVKITTVDKHQNLHYTWPLSHDLTHHQNQLYITYCLKDI